MNQPQVSSEDPCESREPFLQCVQTSRRKEGAARSVELEANTCKAAAVFVSCDYEAREEADCLLGDFTLNWSPRQLRVLPKCSH
jgi:hypothetical protein